ncbi:hypothetical protein [uncultured Gimesia sp.]|uniref:hypothetical protein n=1 Tax=uncultured Gimesia sp. TaxID=1678688 RepID=UPI0026116A83|nr:hypothetical protein [uncultured Gimesia sp.]
MEAIDENKGYQMPRHWLVYTPRSGLLSRLKIASPVGLADTVLKLEYDIEWSEKPLPESICTFIELQSLSLSNMKLTAREALIIGKLKNITSISFFDCNLSTEFCSNFPIKNRISDIYLYDTKVGTSNLSNLLNRIPGLTDLSIGKYNLTSEVIKNIQSLRLESLSLRHCSVDKEILQQIIKIKTLEYIDLSYNTLASRTFEMLATLPKLRHLDIRGTTFSPTELSDLSASKSLAEIWISSREMKSSDLDPLFKIRTLKHITAVLPTKEPHPKTHKDIKVDIIRYDYETE